MPAREGEDPDVGGLCGGDPLAGALAALKPAPAGVNRDEPLFGIPFVGNSGARAARQCRQFI